MPVNLFCEHLLLDPVPVLNLVEKITFLFVACITRRTRVLFETACITLPHIVISHQLLYHKKISLRVCSKVQSVHTEYNFTLFFLKKKAWAKQFLRSSFQQSPAWTLWTSYNTGTAVMVTRCKYRIQTLPRSFTYGFGNPFPFLLPGPC